MLIIGNIRIFLCGKRSKRVFKYGKMDDILDIVNFRKK